MTNKYYTKHGNTKIDMQEGQFKRFRESMKRHVEFMQRERIFAVLKEKSKTCKFFTLKDLKLWIR